MPFFSPQRAATEKDGKYTALAAWRQRYKAASGYYTFYAFFSPQRAATEKDGKYTALAARRQRYKAASGYYTFYALFLAAARGNRVDRDVVRVLWGKYYEMSFLFLC